MLNALRYHLALALAISLYACGGGGSTGSSSISSSSSGVTGSSSSSSSSGSSSSNGSSSSSSGSGATNYTLTELAPLSSGGTGTFVSAVNDVGQAVGYTGYGDVDEPQIWDGATTTALQQCGLACVTTAINSSGTIAGYGFGSAGAQAVTWTGISATTLTNPSMGPDQNAEAYAINDAGQVVGYINNEATGNNNATSWIAGAPTALASNGADVTVAQGINNTGQIVGYAGSNSSDTETAVVWHGTVMSELASLGGPQTQATAVNDAGQVVGWSNLPAISSTTNQYISHATSWNGNAVTDLGTLGGSISQALSIDASGQIVGNSTLATDPTSPSGATVTHAVIWNHGVIVDLNTELAAAVSVYVTLANATGINDSGQIVANGTDSRIHNGNAQLTPMAFLLTPVVSSNASAASK